MTKRHAKSGTIDEKALLFWRARRTAQESPCHVLAPRGSLRIASDAADRGGAPAPPKDPSPASSQQRRVIVADYYRLIAATPGQAVRCQGAARAVACFGLEEMTVSIGRPGLKI
jgi:hypothetical protein